MSEIVYKVHSCAPPITTRGLGVGSVWQCAECESRFELIWANNFDHITHYQTLRWARLSEKHWNQAENRPLSQAERFDLIQWPEPRPSLKQRILAFIKRDNK